MCLSDANTEAYPLPRVSRLCVLLTTGAYNWNWQVAASGWLDLSGGPRHLPSFGLTMSPYPENASSRWQLAIAR